METMPERPEGLCGPLCFVTQRDDFACVGIDRSRMHLCATTKVWIDNGVPHSAVVTFVLNERWPLLRQMNLKTQFTCDNDTQGFSGYFQKNLNI